ncbi:MAG: small multi-drug export protein [Clostridia bacterium]|nr:small multi-drug export protein [Clostridia bacterium]
MTEKIIDFVRELIGNDYITTILISIIPIVELRGAIPAAMTMGLNAGVSFALAWVGSALVAPILLLILRPILNWMKKYKAFASFADAIESGFKSKAMKVVGESNGQLTAEQAKKLERKKMLGVYLFVAFPIPLTGVWTGSAVATFLDIPFWKSMAMVWLGNLTAGAIVTVLAVFLKSYMNIVLDVFFVIVILVLLLYIARVVIKMVKNKKNKAISQSDETTNNSIAEDKIDTDTQKMPSDVKAEEQNAIDTSVTAQVSENQKEELK